MKKSFCRTNIKARHISQQLFLVLDKRYLVEIFFAVLKLIFDVLNFILWFRTIAAESREACATMALYKGWGRGAGGS